MPADAPADSPEADDVCVACAAVDVEGVVLEVDVPCDVVVVGVDVAVVEVEEVVVDVVPLSPSVDYSKRRHNVSLILAYTGRKSLFFFYS